MRKEKKIMEGTPTFPITADMLEPITDYLTSAVTVAAPIGIAILAVMLGVKFVPKIINKIKGN